MNKILFTSYQPYSFFPKKFVMVPEMVKADTAQFDANNMNMIEESAFHHNKLKKDVLGILLGNYLPTKNVNRKHLLTMAEYYEGKNMIYEKFAPNPKSQCLATYILDTKAVLKH